MPGLSIHVVDVSRGLLCEGMRVTVYALESIAEKKLICEGLTKRSGLLEDPALAGSFAAGRYRAVFQVGDYFRRTHVVLPLVPFLDVVSFDFGVDDPQQHYHLPMKVTPWGYSCFRGGS